MLTLRTKKIALRLPRPDLAKGIRLLLLPLLLAYLAWQLYADGEAAASWRAFEAVLSPRNLPFLLAVLLLMPVNWMLEVFKWQILQARIQRLSFGRAVRGVLIGAAFSLFTPNRTGEYAGRVMVVSSERRWQTVVATLVGSMAQLLALLSGGALAGIIWLWLRRQALGLGDTLIVGLAMLACAGIGTMLLLYFRAGLLSRLLAHRPAWAWLQRQVAILNELDGRELLQVLMYSYLRYAVYTIQYVLMTCFFGFQVSTFDTVVTVAVLFFLQTGIPLPPISGLAARGGLALWFWGQYAVPSVSILAATLGLWVINVVIPALWGGILMLFDSHTTHEPKA